MPFRVVAVGTVASPNLPARKGILALRHAHTTINSPPIGGSGLSQHVEEFSTDWVMSTAAGRQMGTWELGVGVQGCSA